MFRVIPAFVFCALLIPSAQKPVLVSAAISLSDALREVEKAYVAAGGGRVEFNFAGSNVLARQIANGAPVDLFISADDAQMDYAQRHGGIDGRTRVALLANRLAVVTPSGAAPVNDAHGLLAREITRVAIGDPAAVPVGVYSKQYLERIKLWHPLQPKLLPLANVRAALAAVESGGADAAFVYESDVVNNSRVRVAFVVDGPHAPRIIYPAAITTSSKHADAAKRFLAFLQEPQARQIFQRYKFSSK